MHLANFVKAGWAFCLLVLFAVAAVLFSMADVPSLAGVSTVACVLAVPGFLTAAGVSVPSFFSVVPVFVLLFGPALQTSLVLLVSLLLKGS